MSEFDVDLPSSSWRHVLYPLSWLGSITVLSLLFSLVRMHQRLNLINGLYALLFSVSAVGIPVEFYFLLQTGLLADIRNIDPLELEEYQEYYCARYWETWASMYALNVTILFCSMFARFVYIRYASGLVELGTRLFQLLVMLSVVFLYGFFTAFALGFILKPGYPHSFIKGKICLKEKISEWSPSGDLDREFSLKPKLIAWVLVFLFEASIQFFCASASLTCQIWYAFVDQQLNAFMEYNYENLGVEGCFSLWWWWNFFAITVANVVIPLYILVSSWREFGFEVSRETEMSSEKEESHTSGWDYQDYTHHFTYMA